MADPTTTPYVIEILTPSPDAAGNLADKIAALPEVQQALTVNDFIPDDQDEKIAIPVSYTHLDVYKRQLS